MLSRAGKLNLLSHHLDLFDINKFQGRKILQKTVYILREMGMNFRYSYNWYIHGPYSPQLADDAYEIETNKKYYDDEIAGYRYKSKAKEKITRFEVLFEGRAKDDEWMELVSSLLFLKEHYPTLGDEELRDNLLQRKPKFREKAELVGKAIQLIEDILT